jgi:hypothetical protein
MIIMGIKNKKATVYTEFLAVALLLTFLSYRLFRLHPAVALLIFIVAYLVCYLLFLKNKTFRSAFAVIAVFGWAVLAYFTSRWVGHVSSATAWVFAMLAFLIAILGYRDFIVFKKYK